jgi:hypothetical protein
LGSESVKNVKKKSLKRKRSFFEKFLKQYQLGFKELKNTITKIKKITRWDEQ